MQPELLLLVDHQGNIQEKESGPSRYLNRAAYMIHSAVHEARPDILCAAHSHTIHAKAFSALGVPLDPITQDSCAFYKVSRARCSQRDIPFNVYIGSFSV
jgi:ribulose-5-phosphate 4-epimerase/fuculose-1-phosphate aldolase